MQVYLQEKKFYFSHPEANFPSKSWLAWTMKITDNEEQEILTFQFEEGVSRAKVESLARILVDDTVNFLSVSEDIYIINKLEKEQP